MRGESRCGGYASRGVGGRGLVFSGGCGGCGAEVVGAGYWESRWGEIGVSVMVRRETLMGGGMGIVGGFPWGEEEGSENGGGGVENIG